MARYTGLLAACVFGILLAASSATDTGLEVSEGRHLLQQAEAAGDPELKAVLVRDLS